ncbi:hypothetical protein OG455_30800 [Kitasatospora sp. NBC_01287]|uniref:hypothetical protein n=1 Tax=Kitasatospora sp. NBC_01287 TaxID=2903573 RepID=UPI00225624A2|nr:hypothetical protein [Kitasatospora sp. NBC_01287]MCX4749854.1 hypothetical protein [Kitasatospora sp. NBC_01287]
MAQYGSAAANDDDSAADHGSTPDTRAADRRREQASADLAKREPDTYRPDSDRRDTDRRDSDRRDSNRSDAGRRPAGGRFAVVPAGEQAAPRGADSQSATDNAAVGSGSGSGWLAPERAQRLRAEWHSVQAGFVDDPRQSVDEADALVEKSIGLITEAVAERRRQLRGPDPAPGEEPAGRTEELRLTLRQYRTLLDRLLDA